MSTKISNLTAAASPLATTDIFPAVLNPGTTPINRKVTLAVLKESLVLYTVYADDFAGADMGAKINAAYAALPTTGGIIIVPGGDYSYSTGIVFNVKAKHVQLRGAPTTGTILRWTGSGKGAALQYNIDKEMTAGHGIEDIKFIGPGSAGVTLGLLLGGLGADDAKGAAGIMIRNVHVRGFGLGVCIANNTYLITFDNVVNNFNGKLLFMKGGAGLGATDYSVNGANTINTGENMRFVNCLFADSNNQLFSESVARYAVHLQCSGLTDTNFIGCSFDDAELYLDHTGGTSNDVRLIACHFESPAGDSIGKYRFITELSNAPSTILNMAGVTFVYAQNVNRPDELVYLGGEATAKDITISKNNGGGSAIGKFCTFATSTSTDTLAWSGLKQVGTSVTYVVGTTAPTNTGWASGDGGIMTISDQGKISKRSGTTTSSATPTINTDIYDYYSLSAQAADITSFTTNLTGSPVDNDDLTIKITGTASRAITWGSKFEASTVALPTTTSSTTMLIVKFIYNATTAKWRCVLVA